MRPFAFTSAFVVVAVALADVAALAQVTPDPSPAAPADSATDPATNAVPVLPNGGDAKLWAFSVSAYTYLVPDEDVYVQPTFTADRGWLHLEARYNYEALETGSAWIGYNLSVGEKVTFEFTPMLGGVFGDVTGLAPGYEGTLSWWKLSLYSEGEYVFDTGDSSESFFYSWSELTLAPLEWFRFGLVAQRTRVYESDRELQRGVLVGFTYKQVDLSAYLFNPDEAEPTYVFAVAFSF